MTYIQEFKANADIIEQYKAPVDALKKAKVLLAWYGYGDYCGDSLVIYTRDKKLYEVNGSHCSCFGLEGQWEPAETSWKVLALRNLGGSCDGSAEADKQLKRLVRRHLK